MLKRFVFLSLASLVILAGSAFLADSSDAGLYPSNAHESNLVSDDNVALFAADDDSDFVSARNDSPLQEISLDKKKAKGAFKGKGMFKGKGNFKGKFKFPFPWKGKFQGKGPFPFKSKKTSYDAEPFVLHAAPMGNERAQLTAYMPADVSLRTANLTATRIRDRPGC